MRALLLLSIALVATSCRQEPTFDERYDDAKAEIFEKAEEIDSEVGDGSQPEPEAERHSLTEDESSEK